MVFEEMMERTTDHILELIRLTATDLPEDVEQSLREASEREVEGSAARKTLETILENVALARGRSTPICQDTGTPIFYVQYPRGVSTIALKNQIVDAVVEATQKAYLRPNAVETLSGKNSGDNTGDIYFPVIHFEEVTDQTLTVDLMLKGGGCENVGAQYALPNEELGAGRDLNGVRKAVLHAVHKAQGRGCAPGILGVAVGGDRSSGYLASKEVLLHKLDENNPNEELALMEKQITDQANQLGIGPMGFGGQTTLLDTKIEALHRLPASYFVTISYMCWACRRRRLIIDTSGVTYV